MSKATAFTPANAASASQVWHWQPPVITGEPAPVLDASPTVAAGQVYIGAQSGGFYALNESTGAVLWSRQLDTRPMATCRSLGITSTAAVLADPVTGTTTVYASGARYLYALDAATGAVTWQTEIGPPDQSTPDAYYNWSSPTVAWQAPGTAGHDWDFGSSPTLFGRAGLSRDVGACNKNGLYYALAASPLSNSPLWADTIGVPANGVACIASAVWDGPAGTLYIGGNATTIGTTSYAGSIRQVDPATGGYIWQAGLPCAVVGTPTLDSSGVLAVGGYRCAKAAVGAYLIDAASGAALTVLHVGSSRVFSQPVFAQGTLFVAAETNGLYDFAP